MGVIIPSIPYKSQLDPDAGDFRNDCGPASLAMILHAFSVEVSTNTVYRKTGAKGNGYVSISQLMRAGQAYGVPFEYFTKWSINHLKAAIKGGHPVIPLIHYEEFVKVKPGKSTQFNFKGPHFLVAVGYDDQHVYLNDPLWTGGRRKEGERRKWTYAQFMDAWGSCYKDGNRNFSGMVSRRSLSTDAWNELDNTTPPTPPYKMDPITHLRIKAWAAFYDIPLPQINNPAVANAYVAAMGQWGLRVVTHRIRESDTLGLLALQYYDDPMKWDVISHFNGLGLGDTIHDNDIVVIPEPMDKPVTINDESVPQGGTYEFRSALNSDENSV